MAQAQPSSEPGFARLLRHRRAARHEPARSLRRGRRVVAAPELRRDGPRQGQPTYRATALDAPAMAQVRRALDLMLRQQEPFPAIVLDRHWSILDANAATGRLVSALLAPETVTELGGNAMRLMCHPDGFRPHMVNWEAVAAALIQWLHRDVLSGFADAETRRLLEELLGYPGVPPRWRTLDLDISRAAPARGGPQGPSGAPLLQRAHEPRYPARHHPAGTPHRGVLSGRRGDRAPVMPPRRGLIVNSRVTLIPRVHPCGLGFGS